ncbi:MAG TPA: hypothetical protein VLF68_01895 [Candidatus Saccharimonadales bacterium]|nr:hypothetical protein [Candidatus Saccharimonadales bacterium]
MARSLHHKKHKIAYVLVAILLLFVIATLPFAVTSIFQDFVDQSNTTYTIEHSATHDTSIDNIHVHVDVVSLNEWDGTANFRVSTYNNCSKNCTPKRIVFSSVLDTLNHTEDVPTSQEILLTTPGKVETQTVILPLFGDPIRYPYDEFNLGLGLQIIDNKPEGHPATASAANTNNHVDFTLQARVPRIVMEKPTPVAPTKIGNIALRNAYTNVELLTFTRPLYIQLLTLVLILLISIAAACAVFMRPLNEIVINSGALVLGVWGIRSILLGTAVPGITSVDLALSVIILFLLIGIAVRTFHFLDDQSGIHMLKIRKKSKDKENN